MSVIKYTNIIQSTNNPRNIFYTATTPGIRTFSKLYALRECVAVRFASSCDANVSFLLTSFSGLKSLTAAISIELCSNLIQTVARKWDAIAETVHRFQNLLTRRDSHLSFLLIARFLDRAFMSDTMLRVSLKVTQACVNNDCWVLVVGLSSNCGRSQDGNK